VRNLRIADTGGDGIFIGGGVPCRWPGDHRCVAGSPGCLRIHIVDCVLANAYRNGMSVISAVDLLVERTVFSGTNGTNPKAGESQVHCLFCPVAFRRQNTSRVCPVRCLGVDLEPDYPQQRFQNVSFNDCVSNDNAGAGFSVALQRLNGSSQAVSVSVRNLTVDGGQSEGLVIGGVRPEVRGTINVSDSLVRGTWGGSGVYDKASDGAPVRIENVRFQDVATHPTAGGMSHMPLIVYGSGDYHGDNRSYDCGGVTFEAVTVVDQRDRAFFAGDVPAPRAVRGVHGHIAVRNPFGCHTSFPSSAEQVDVIVSCSTTTPQR
jgi:hypothetical protein